MPISSRLCCLCTKNKLTLSPECSTDYCGQHPGQPAAPGPPTEEGQGRGQSLCDGPSQSKAEATEGVSPLLLRVQLQVRPPCRPCTSQTPLQGFAADAASQSVGVTSPLSSSVGVSTQAVEDVTGDAAVRLLLYEAASGDLLLPSEARPNAPTSQPPATHEEVRQYRK